MSKLRAYLQEYIQDLTNLLEQTQDDKAIVGLAMKKGWKLTDPRLVVITAAMSGQLFRNKDKGTGGSDTGGEQNQPVGFNSSDKGCGGSDNIGEHTD